MLDARLEQEKADALANERYEVAERLEKLRGPIQELQGEAMLLTIDDVTDGRYKLEDRKRKIAQELNQITAGKRIERLRSDYQEQKENVTSIVNESGNDNERRQLNEIVSQEHAFLASTNPQKLEAAINQLRQISFQILRRTPTFLIGWFEHLVGKRETLNDQLQSKNLIEAGRKHIALEDFDKLAEVNVRLSSLLPQREKDSKEMKTFTGIS
jgi:molecular chaperone DnaK